MDKHFRIGWTGLRLFLSWWAATLLILPLMGGLIGLGVALFLTWPLLLVPAVAGGILQFRAFHGLPQAPHFGAVHRNTFPIPWSKVRAEAELSDLLRSDLGATHAEAQASRLHAFFEPPAQAGWWRKWSGSDELSVDLHETESGSLAVVTARPVHLLWAGGLWIDLGRNAQRLVQFQMALGARLDAEAQRKDAASAALSLEARLAQAELLLVRAQVEPHFLFNTLAHLRETVASGERETALAMLDHLITHTRSTSDRMRQASHPLKKEVDAVQAYLSLMQLRFGDRFRFRVEVEEEALPVQVPVGALLIPAENAVKHGMESLSSGGQVDILGQKTAGALVLEVLDNGPGLPPSPHGQGTGLANLRERLRLAHPGAQLHLSDREEGGVHVRLTLPL